MYEKATHRSVDPPSVHYFGILATFVEAALVAIGLAYAARVEPPFIVALTVYPQLNITARMLVDDIEDYEAGRHVL